MEVVTEHIALSIPLVLWVTITALFSHHVNQEQAVCNSYVLIQPSILRPVCNGYIFVIMGRL
ncbi:hypothetical protein ACLOJK_010084 [Asimina triloba]